MLRQILIKALMQLGWQRKDLLKYSTEELREIFSESNRIEGNKF